MPDSVGKVTLDVGLNQKSLNKQVSDIGKSSSKIFGAMSVAIGGMISNVISGAVRSFGSFISSSIELGSNIAELENVVDSVFPNMQSQVDSWSKDALASFGLTESQAKKMLGTFGAMSESFGYSEKDAYAMSEALTGLAGDVSSFYNIDAGEAYTKLKGVFTGETESLKELGVVMTANALDQYALSNGYGKTTSAMTEQEKVALRLAFVQNTLAKAQGDFTNTSDGWANQTRVLSGQFDALKASIGQGMIYALKPVVQMLNNFIGRLRVAAEAFSSFMANITGSQPVTGLGDTMSEVADATSSTSDSMADTATSAKETENSLMGFDQLNKIGDDSGGGTSASPQMSSPSGASTPLVSDAAGNAGQISAVREELEKIASITGLDKLWDGFNDGFQKIDIDSIKSNLSSIFSDLQPIASASLSGLQDVLSSFMSFAGTTIGNISSIVGKSIDISTRGIAKFLERNTGDISAWVRGTAKTISGGFDNLSFGAGKIFGMFWKALDNNEERISESISNSLTAWSGAGMTIGTIAADMWAGVTQSFADFVSNNSADLQTYFDGSIQLWINFSNLISTVVSDLFTSLNTFWETSGKPMWDNFVKMFEDVAAWAVRLYNEFVQPILKTLIAELSKLWNEHLKPLWDNILQFARSIGEAIIALWNGIIKPVVDWIVENVVPPIKQMIQIVINIIGDLFGMISDTISSMIKVITGIIDFLVGVFTGDWEKAWNGIKEIVGGIWDGIWGAIKGTINLLIDGLNALWAGLYFALRQIVNGVGGMIEKLGGLIGQDWGFSIPNDAPMIPRLAKGGFLEANSPTLAFVGDNKTQGEIVSPVDKMQEAFRAVLQEFVAGMVPQSQSAQTRSEILQLIVNIGEETFVSKIIDLVNEESTRMGKNVIEVRVG